MRQETRPRGIFRRINATFFAALMATLCLMINPVQAEEDYYTVRDLQKDCVNYRLLTAEPQLATEKGAASLGQCHGFVAGIIDGLRFFQSNYESLPKTQFACPPGDIEIGHMIDEILNHIQTRNPRDNEPAVLTAVNALTAAYPCR